MQAIPESSAVSQRAWKMVQVLYPQVFFHRPVFQGAGSMEGNPEGEERAGESHSANTYASCTTEANDLRKPLAEIGSKTQCLY